MIYGLTGMSVIVVIHLMLKVNPNFFDIAQSNTTLRWDLTNT